MVGFGFLLFDSVDLGLGLAVVVLAWLYVACLGGLGL